MKKKICIFLIFAAVPVMLLAGYDENMAAGLAAYKQDKLVDAYKYFYAAYKEKPSQRIQNVLAFIKKKYFVEQKAAKPVPALESPWKWVLVGTDVAAMGFTVYAGMDYYKQADKYDTLYAEKNNTTMDNYNMLTAESKTFHDKEGVYTAGVIISSLAISYTLADLFFIHAAFPVKAAMSFDPKSCKTWLAMNYMY